MATFSEMPRPSYLRLIRFWLSERAGVLGLAVGVLVIIGAVALALPIGPPERLEGRVLKLGLRETETGSRPRAVVQLESGQIAVDLPRANSCAVGAKVRLSCSRRLWGIHCGGADCNVQ